MKPKHIDSNTPVDIRELPVLQAALWDIHATILPAETVLHIYEDRWRYLDVDQMGPYEHETLQNLITEIGNGVFLAR